MQLIEETLRLRWKLLQTGTETMQNEHFEKTEMLRRAFNGAVTQAPPAYYAWRRMKLNYYDSPKTEKEKRKNALGHLPTICTTAWIIRKMKPPSGFDSARYLAEIRTGNPDISEQVVLDVRPNQSYTLRALDEALDGFKNSADPETRIVEIDGMMDVKRWEDPVSGHPKTMILVHVIFAMSAAGVRSMVHNRTKRDES